MPLLPLHRRRAFSLIEVMVVVAILSVLVALAAPSLLAEVQKTKLNSAAEQLASFLARAQNEASVSRRCVTVRVANPQTLIAERFNVFDCDNAPATATKISSASTATAIEFAKLKLESELLTFSYDGGANGSVICNECNPAPGGAGAEIRFRPNGRVFSNDGNLANDDAIMVVSHTTLTAGVPRQAVLVNGNGLICVIKRGSTPGGTAPDFTCP